MEPPQSQLGLLQPPPGGQVHRRLWRAEQQQRGEGGHEGAEVGDVVPGQQRAQRVDEDGAEAARHAGEHEHGAARLPAHHLHRVDRGGQQPVPRPHQHPEHHH